MSNDLIRRDVLNDILDLYEKYHPRLATNVYAFGVALRELIENTPTVSFMINPDYVTELQNHNKELIKQLEDMERPTGEWKVNLTTGDIFCSCCKEVRRDTRINHINFCNSCGADMRKGGAE